jgi:hypothetical protein
MLPRDEVARGSEEMIGFSNLVRSLDEREFRAPSRCRGWSAGDFAAHLIGAFADITSGRVEGQGTPEVSERQVAERRGRTAAELASELDELTKRVDETLASLDDASWNGPARGGYDSPGIRRWRHFGWAPTYTPMTSAPRSGGRQRAVRPSGERLPRCRPPWWPWLGAGRPGS